MSGIRGKGRSVRRRTEDVQPVARTPLSASQFSRIPQDIWELIIGFYIALSSADDYASDVLPLASAQPRHSLTLTHHVAHYAHFEVAIRVCRLWNTVGHSLMDHLRRLIHHVTGSRWNVLPRKYPPVGHLWNLPPHHTPSVYRAGVLAPKRVPVSLITVEPCHPELVLKPDGLGYRLQSVFDAATKGSHPTISAIAIVEGKIMHSVKGSAATSILQKCVRKGQLLTEKSTTFLSDRMVDSNRVPLLINARGLLKRQTFSQCASISSE